MNIQQWRGFLCVAKARNITKAADEIHVTQQALSRTLNQLESELGTQLFTRIESGTGLTEVGRKILPIVENLVEHEERYTKMIRNVIQENSFSLKIAFENTVLINSFSAELLSKIGNFKVTSYMAGDNVTCIDDVKQSKASCAFAFKPENLQELSYFQVVRRRPNVIMSKNHYLASRKEIHIEDLKDVNHSWLSINSASFKLYYKACIEKGFYPKITSEYPSAELQHQALSDGQEITIGGGFIFTPNEKNLVRIPLVCDSFWVDVGFIYRADKEADTQLKSYFTVVKYYLEAEET